MSKNYLGRSYLTKEEKKNKYLDYLRAKDYESSEERYGCETPGRSLLDSSLITPTQNFKYDTKIIECGKYVQVYFFENVKSKHKNKPDEIDIDNLYKSKETYSKRNELKIIEYKNINRSKFQLQRIVKANEDNFKTFITLTFADNVKSIDVANKKFDIWRTKIKSIYKDFQYVCVPEFQKRGAVHYHLLTNLEIEKVYQYSRRNKELEAQLILPQKDKKSQYDVKYWSYGYSSVFSMKDINVIGYISKYMTKDIDNRLYGRRRYLCSYNLNMPKEFVFEKDSPDLIHLLNIMNSSEITFKKEYLDIYENTINFIEYKRNGD